MMMLWMRSSRWKNSSSTRATRFPVSRQAPARFTGIAAFVTQLLTHGAAPLAYGSGNLRACFGAYQSGSRFYGSIFNTFNDPRCDLATHHGEGFENRVAIFSVLVAIAATFAYCSNLSTLRAHANAN